MSTTITISAMNLTTLITTLITTTTTTTTTTSGSPSEGRFSGSWAIALIVVGGAIIVALLGLVGIWLRGYMRHHWPEVLPVPVEPVPAPQQPTPAQWMEMVAMRGQCPPVAAVATAASTTCPPAEKQTGEEQRVQGKKEAREEQQAQGDGEGPEENDGPGKGESKRPKDKSPNILVKKTKFWPTKASKKPSK